MAQGYIKVEGEDIELLNSASESDGSEGELAPPQSLLKKRTTGLLVGLALVGVALIAILSSRSGGASLRNGNIDATVQLNGGKTSTSLFIIKHTFKSEDDVKPWWGFFKNSTSDQEGFKAWIEKMAKAGFFNVMFLPTAPGGPFYCIWEGEAGKTKEEMEDFIDKSKLSPALKLKNEVIPIDLKLVGGVLPGIPDYFSPQSRRLLADRELEDAPSVSSFYLVKHTFKKKADPDLWWNHTNALMASPKGFQKWIVDVRELGFDDPGRMFPVAKEGPFYCLWEAKAGKTKDDFQEFIDTNKLSPAAEVMNNEVMEIPLKLMGGHPPFMPTFEEEEGPPKP